MKRVTRIVFIWLWSTLAAGCSFIGVQQHEVTLKIMLEEVSQTHIQAYRELKEKYPHVNVEFVNIREQVEQPLQIYDNLEYMYLDINPDLVVTNQVTFPLLAPQSHFLNLESILIRDGELLIEDIHKPVMQWIRDYGNGQISGLAPYYDTDVLFFNKAMFDHFGVSYLEDQMTWREMIDLIMRFPTSNQQGDRIFGFHSGYEGDTLFLLDRISQTNGLSYLDWENKKVTYEDERWQDIYELVTSAHQSGMLLQNLETHEDSVSPMELFKQNKLAVMLGTYETFVALSSEHDLEFGVVTQPIAEDERDAGFLYLNEIYSVNANSTNTDLAWKFILEAMKQEEPHKLKSLVQKGEEASVFYKLDYKRENRIHFWEVPLGFSSDMQILRKETLASILSGEVSIQDALEVLESDGQALLGHYLPE